MQGETVCLCLQNSCVTQCTALRPSTQAQPLQTPSPVRVAKFTYGRYKQGEGQGRWPELWFLERHYMGPGARRTSWRKEDFRMTLKAGEGIGGLRHID